MKNFMKGFTIVAVTLCAAGAQAALINVGDGLTISGDIDTAAATIGSVYYNGGGEPWSGAQVYAGAFQVNVLNNTQAGSQFSIFSFCTDVGVDWQYGNQFYTAMSFGGVSGVNPQWSAKPEAIQNASYIYNNIFLGMVNNNGVYTGTADQAAGVQLAIWKVLYDTANNGSLKSKDFSSGVFTATGFGGGIADAESDLAALVSARAGTSFPLYSDTWLQPDNGTSQGLIWNNSTPSSPVPEPTTVLAGMLLLLPFGASTLRILRRNRAA
jgi:hypothetical protein